MSMNKKFFFLPLDKHGIRASTWLCLVERRLHACVGLNGSGSSPNLTIEFFQYVCPRTESVYALILSVSSPQRQAKLDKIG